MAAQASFPQTPTTPSQRVGTAPNKKIRGEGLAYGSCCQGIPYWWAGDDGVRKCKCEREWADAGGLAATYHKLSSSHIIAEDGTNIRIANRRIITASLKKCLALDVAVSSFDISFNAGLMITAAQKVVYLWDLEHLTVLHKLPRPKLTLLHSLDGQQEASIEVFVYYHLRGRCVKFYTENIRDCKFDENAFHFASAGEDKRIVVWNVKSHKAVKVLEGHKGTIFQVEFGSRGDHIYSGSDDGRVLVWEWRTGSCLMTFMRHSAAVRCFQTYPDRPDRIICGRSDGNVSVWDLGAKSIVDNISPDPEWVSEGDEQSMVGWIGAEKHHSGSIMSLCVSPNGRFLATGATDHTTKLWAVVSYLKDVEGVLAEQNDANAKIKELDSLIPVHDEKYDIQIELKEFTGLRIGEVPLPMGYHADLIFTFRHEAPVLCLTFNTASDILITGSMDSTCRLWSCRRGDLLFQINLPSPVTDLMVNRTNEDLYVICLNRVLLFEIQASEKEEDLPEYWKRHELDSALERLHLETKQREASRRGEGVGGVRNHFGQEDDDEAGEDLNEKRPLTVPQLKQLISHGLVLPSFLDTLVDQYKAIDATQLHQNMKKFGIDPRQILRLIVNTKFHPKDLLIALAKKGDADYLYNSIQTGTPITSFMLKHGYRVMADEDREDARQERKRELINSLFGGNTFSQNGVDYVLDAQGRRIPIDQLQDQMYEDAADDEYQWYMDNQFAEDDEGMEEDDVDFSLQKHKGTVLHFIPSEQIKLLKDFQAKRDVKPIFMRQILLDRQPAHPNFNSSQAIVKDTKPNVVDRTIPKAGVRFNEPITGKTYPLKSSKTYTYEQPPQKRGLQNLPSFLGPKASFSSSRTVFKPDRYLNARGLNILFGNNQDDPRSRRTLNLRNGHVYAEPLIFGERRHSDMREQFIVGKSMSVKEATIDEFLGIDNDN
ncbi:hypothetical protein HDU67_006292 [Dinochytrium kinnereticum]|nr:hypothetical protein HDU67_006292 [Dinochytrium kinnereticum]